MPETSDIYKDLIGLADCNNFFVSCHRVFEPQLNGRPVIVMSDNDGCAVARSNEVKKLGIKMGTPVFEIKDLIAKHDITLFSSQFALYGDMSKRVMNILSRFVPETEVYSIDECFLNFAGMNVDLKEYGREIVEYTTQGSGIPISLGVAPTKALAKIANKFAKKYAGYRGVCVIDSEDKRIKALQRTEIGDVWGIGRRYEKRLRARGINTAYDFAQLPREWVRKEMTVVGEQLHGELNGEKCFEMELTAPPKKQILSSKSFGKDIYDLATIQESVAEFAGVCGRKLRAQGSCAAAVGVFMWTNPHKKHLGSHSASLEVTLPVPTDSTLEIVKYARMLCPALFREGLPFKKAGVYIPKIVGKDAVQGNMFYELDRERHDKLMAVIDGLNGQYGRGTVKCGAEGTTREWRLNRQRLSPLYTTRIEDIIVAK